MTLTGLTTWLGPVLVSLYRLAALSMYFQHKIVRVTVQQYLLQYTNLAVFENFCHLTFCVVQ